MDDPAKPKYFHNRFSRMYFYFLAWPRSCGHGPTMPENKNPFLTEGKYFGFAERGGFEPPVQLPIRQFSKLLV
jgi:hypothetical protein